MENKLMISSIAGTGIALAIALLIIPSYAGTDTYFINSGSGSGNGTATCTNLGNGTLICPSYAGGNLNIRTISGFPPDMDIDVINDTIYVVNNSPESSVCTNAVTGGAFRALCAVTTFVGGEITIKALEQGTGMTLTPNIDSVTITNSAPDNTACVNLGAGAFQVYKDGECNFRTLIQGSGINMAQSANDITFTNALPEVTTCTNVGTGIQLCSGGNVNVDTLIAGTGITITDTTDDWTFASQCANTGTGEAVCESSNNINSLIAGTGMTVTDTTGDLTLASQCANTGTGEAICESSNNINSLIAGTGIDITDTTGDLTVATDSDVPLKLCDAIASGGETTLTCTFSTSSTVKNFIIQSSFTSTSGDTWALRFNGDGGNNYAFRSSTNGGADATSANTAHIASVVITANQWYHYDFECTEPLSTQEKHCYGFRTTSANGAGNVDARVEFASKWANTASKITDTELVRTAGTGTMTAGSFITVWGVK